MAPKPSANATSPAKENIKSSSAFVQHRDGLRNVGVSVETGQALINSDDVKSRPNEVFHHRGGGRWALGMPTQQETSKTQIRIPKTSIVLASGEKFIKTYDPTHDFITADQISEVFEDPENIHFASKPIIRKNASKSKGKNKKKAKVSVQPVPEQDEVSDEGSNIVVADMRKLEHDDQAFDSESQAVSDEALGGFDLSAISETVVQRVKDKTANQPKGAADEISIPRKSKQAQKPYNTSGFTIREPLLPWSTPFVRPPRTMADYPFNTDPLSNSTDGADMASRDMTSTGKTNQEKPSVPPKQKQKQNQRHTIDMPQLPPPGASVGPITGRTAMESLQALEDMLGDVSDDENESTQDIANRILASRKARTEASAGVKSPTLAKVPPLEMVHFNAPNLLWYGNTPWSVSSAFIDHDDDTYKHGGKVFTGNIDGQMQDFMVCDRDTCASCTLGSSDPAMTFEAESPTAGLLFVHAIDFITRADGERSFTFRQKPYGPYPLPPVGRMWKTEVSFWDNKTREVMVCEVGKCELCKGDAKFVRNEVLWRKEQADKTEEAKKAGKGKGKERR